MRDDRKKALTEGVDRPAENVLAFRLRRSATTARHRDDDTPLRRREVVTPFRASALLRFAKYALPALALVGALAGTSFWILHAPVFALTEIDVEIDGDRVAEAWVRAVLRPHEGSNLPLLTLDEVDGAVRANPWVKATDLRKSLPRRLSVRVVEKLPVALSRSVGEGLHYVDIEGEVIAALDAGFAEVDLPLLATGSSELGLHCAVALMREIEDADPLWARGLSEIEVLSEMDFRVWSAHQPFPLLVRAGTLARKSAYLEKLLDDIRRRYEGVDSVDLRFARKIILQPSVRRSPRRDAGALKKGLSG